MINFFCPYFTALSRSPHRRAPAYRMEVKMDSRKAVNIFCFCVGIAIFLLAVIGATGALSFIYPQRVWLLFFFSAVILIWSGRSLWRKR